VVSRIDHLVRMRFLESRNSDHIRGHMHVLIRCDLQLQINGMFTCAKGFEEGENFRSIHGEVKPMYFLKWESLEATNS
jgi:hypothetical protein